MIDRKIGKIKVRRGTDSQRITNIFEDGEVIYSVDKKRIFVGDDTTLSGSRSSHTCLITAGSTYSASIFVKWLELRY